MNTEMAYLCGMIFGNGEIQRESETTRVTIEIPHKNLRDDQNRDVSIYVSSSLNNIRNFLEPLLGHSLIVSRLSNTTQISFNKPNEEYIMREIMRFVGNGINQSSMTMNEDLFNMSVDEKKEFLRGFADVTGYIRNSNKAFGQEGNHRVYIEIPGSWQLVIDIANMLKDVDVPIQTIDFGHPNFRDPMLKKYNQGKKYFWKKEHQIKIWANEFLAVGFNIEHKQRALELYSNELLAHKDKHSTHKFFWEKTTRRKIKPTHPMESDENIPLNIRGKHFDHWTDLAKQMGYHE